jgi:hypothetical protein
LPGRDLEVDDESIGHAAESLRLLRAEVMRRAERLKALGRELCPDKRTTRAIAAKRSLRLWPVVCVIGEAQNLFAHPGHGKGRTPAANRGLSLYGPRPEPGEASAKTEVN